MDFINIIEWFNGLSLEISIRNQYEKERLLNIKKQVFDARKTCAQFETTTLRFAKQMHPNTVSQFAA